MAEWTDDIESIVFTNVKARFSKKIKEKYPELTFTTDEENVGNAKFPCAYIHLLPMVEQGADLEAKTINACLATFQITVISNKNSNDVKTVMGELTSIFKQLGFSVISFPEKIRNGEIYSSVSRVRRMIGSGDTL